MYTNSSSRIILFYLIPTSCNVPQIDQVSCWDRSGVCLAVAWNREILRGAGALLMFGCAAVDTTFSEFHLNAFPVLSLNIMIVFVSLLLSIAVLAYIPLAHRAHLRRLSPTMASDSEPSAHAPPVPPPRAKLAEEIERQSNHAVNIETVEMDSTFSKSNPQEQSLLFSMLPREIRGLIWGFATAPFEDPDHQYQNTEYYYRPGHTARHKTNAELLLSCRRIWLEANPLPMLQAEHCFWYHRAAPDSRNDNWMAQLTPLNRENFGHLHLFAQFYAIEGLTNRPGALRDYFLKTTAKSGDFQPRMLHVTIRHTDWWFWEHEEPLRFKDSWFQAMLDSPDLRSTHILQLELETLDYKVKQLMPIVERLQNLESKEFNSHVVDGQELSSKFAPHGQPQVHTWSGPVNIDGQTFSPYEKKNKLDYHVITLTWRLKFPQLPKANVAQLRRAPRINNSSRIEFVTYPGMKFDDAMARIPSYYRGFNPFRTPLAIKRRRSRKDVVGENERLRLLHADLQVRMMSVQQDDMQEVMRRRLFQSAMDRVIVERWKRRWQGENSILKFVE